MPAEPRRPPTRRAALRLLAAGGVAAALGAEVVGELLRRGRLRRVASTRTRMGTAVTVTVVHEDAPAARSMAEAAFDEMARLEGILSRHRPDTALSRLNRDGTLAAPPAELVEVLTAARGWAERTGGAFDPTVAPLLDLYAGRFAATGVAPEAGEVEAAAARIGWSDLQVDRRRVAFSRAGMALTLDGIAKGYIVDRAVDTLAAAGAGRVLVDAGGDMASAGEGEAGAWRVAIRHPREPGASLGTLDLRGGCVATSGDYVQAFAQDRTTHHILDPRTGRSPPRACSVTVTAPSAMDADALSTAALVLGPQEGLALLERAAGVEGMVVTKAQEGFATTRFGASTG